jgi:hypothetical protein
MERSKKEILREIKEKSPEIYDELLTAEEKEFVENGQCSQGHMGHGCGGHGHGGGKGCGQGRGGRWGGHRCGSGRPKMFEDRKTITKQVSESTVAKIKEFAQNNDISENEAMDKLINAGYESLNNS